MSELVRCARCAADKPRSEYAPNLKKRNGLHSYCRDCKRFVERRAELKTKYGITPDDFQAMWEAQGGCCDSCGDALNRASQQGYAVDHNHVSGEVRAILCQPCNSGLGHFKDSPFRLRAAAAYLERVGTYEQAARGAKAPLR